MSAAWHAEISRQRLEVELEDFRELRSEEKEPEIIRKLSLAITKLEECLLWLKEIKHV